MKKSQHTPGPWFINECADCVAYEIWDEANRDVVAEARFRSPDDDDEDAKREELANAHLIAAAPDLLAACEEADFLFAHGVGATNSDKGTSEHNIEEAKKIMAQLRGAIAKARGASAQHQHNKALHTDNLQSASLPFGCG